MYADHQLIAIHNGIKPNSTRDMPHLQHRRFHNQATAYLHITTSFRGSMLSRIRPRIMGFQGRLHRLSLRRGISTRPQRRHLLNSTLIHARLNLHGIWRYLMARSISHLKHHMETTLQATTQIACITLMHQHRHHHGQTPSQMGQAMSRPTSNPIRQNNDSHPKITILFQKHTLTLGMIPTISDTHGAPLADS